MTTHMETTNLREKKEMERRRGTFPPNWVCLQLNWMIFLCHPFPLIRWRLGRTLPINLASKRIRGSRRRISVVSKRPISVIETPWFINFTQSDRFDLIHCVCPLFSCPREWRVREWIVTPKVYESDLSISATNWLGTLSLVLLTDTVNEDGGGAALSVGGHFPTQDSWHANSIHWGVIK